MTKFEMSEDKPSAAPGMTLEDSAFPHLTNIEWQALHRLAAVSGPYPRDAGVVERELPCLEGGEVLPSEPSCSQTSASSSGSRRLRKSPGNRSGHRRLRRRAPTVGPLQYREVLNVVEYEEGSPNRARTIEVVNPPSNAATITRLPGLSWKHFLRALKSGEIEQICLLTSSDQPAVLANIVSDDVSSSRPKAAEPKFVREERFAAQSWTALHDSNNSVYSLAHEFEDIFPEKIPAELPAERGVRHDIDLVSGSKYCVTRQRSLPRDQVQAIDDFFEGRRKAGHVRESSPPHSSVKKATGGWRIFNAFNKLNDATIPAQTPIPRKDMVLDTMTGSVIFSAIDLTNGFYQILMKESDTPPYGGQHSQRRFHVVCDASDFAIGYALMQFDDEDRERVVSYQSRQIKPAERNYPVDDKELLAMRYALIKFRVYLLDEQTFAVYTDHTSLRTAMKSPHLFQRVARWLSFFAEHNFVVHYKQGKNDILDDALSRRPDYDPRRLTRYQKAPDSEDDDEDCAVCVGLGINATVPSPVLPLRQQIVDAYGDYAFYAGIIRYLRNPTADALLKLTRPTRDTITRYDLNGDLLTYAIDTIDTPRVVIPADDDLRARLVYEYHDAPVGGHLGREKTFAAISRDFFWPRMYKWIRKWIRSCEICQRVKPVASKQAPLRPLPITTSAWRSISMDIIFGLPRDAQGRTGILVFVDHFSKMVHLAPVAAEVTADESAELFLDLVFRHHGLPESIVLDRDPRFTSAFWTRLFALLGTRLLMSTAAHPETDGQTERVNRVLEDVLRSYATSFPSWSSFLPMAEFALNNATHASTGLTPFFVNNARHPRNPALLAVRSYNPPAVSTLGGGGRAPTSQSVQSSSDPPQSDEPDQETAAEVHVVKGHALHGVAYEELSAVDVSAVDAAMPAESTVANFAPKPTPTPIDSAAVSELLLHRQAVTHFVRDALQAAADQQKANADRRGRKNTLSLRRGDIVLLSTDGIRGSAVTNLGANKLAPRFIGPFNILNVIGDAYTLDIPTSMRLHPTFYVGRLKPMSAPADDADAASARALAPHARALPSEVPRRQDPPSDEADPSSRVAPAPTESTQPLPPQHARAQTQCESEPQSRCSSADQSCSGLT
ncbi:unnamed protein product [Phytophthora fragariaefolia]|uniref:Unnamed protein product n=1 Tax=Phytophthora fragariaefolia TaxID=1490495 RepID=A0A9W6XVG3_9STRA|nr:unnamed protein product [Phytophthora fragariaefolia]